jgi:hypothetical protein
MCQQCDGQGYYRFEAEAFPSVYKLIQHYVTTGQPLTRKTGAVVSNPVINPDNVMGDVDDDEDDAESRKWDLNAEDVELISQVPPAWKPLDGCS